MADDAAPGSVDASGGMENVPPDAAPVALFLSLEQAPSTPSVSAAPIEERRKRRRLIPRRAAVASASTRARRAASRTSGDGADGTYSPFELGPSLIGSPGSTSSTRRLDMHENYARPVPSVC